jgi:hypothetical protein
MKNLLFSVLIILLISSCAKDGETGPAGPAGQDGNANVQVEVFTVNVDDWGFINDFYNEQISTDLLTDDIVEYGSVDLFMQGDPSMWIALPDVELDLGYAYEKNTLYLFTKVEPTETIVLKLVVIDGLPE